MKKYILVLLLGGILITTTGCFNSKTLTCTSSTMDTGFKATTEIAVEFDGDDAKSLTLTSTTEFDSSSKDIMDEYESLLNDTVEEYKNDGYITSLERDGDSIIYYTASKQIEDMSEEERETFGIESSMTTYDTYKNGFEKMGYTCE